MTRPLTRLRPLAGLRPAVPLAAAALMVAVAAGGCGGSKKADAAGDPHGSGSTPAASAPASGGTPGPASPAAPHGAPAAGGSQAVTGGGPFTGTWHSDGSSAGEGGTTLTVNGDGTLRFESTVNCTGSSRRAKGRSYTFSFDCGTAKFTGTAKDPAGGKSFVMEWEEGDTSAFHAVS